MKLIKLQDKFILVSNAVIKVNDFYLQDTSIIKCIDEVGGIAAFISQYFFTIDDIAVDLHTNQPAGLILDWQGDGVDYNMFNETPQTINYKSYTMGLRYKDLKK